MLAVLLIVVVVMFGTAGGHLFKIMVLDSELYMNKAYNQHLSDVEIAPLRGNIYDSNMELLASSTTVWTAYITPSKIKNAEDPEKIRKLIIDGLVDILGVEREAAEKSVNKNIAYEIVKRQVERPMAESMRTYIKENKIGSFVGFDESSKRNYPGEELLSNVLGFVGNDNQGLAGLEAYYDSTLKGTPGRVVAIKNGIGDNMPYTYEKMIDVKPGNSLVLNIDKQVQSIIEKYLEQVVKETGVKERATIIAMNPQTGGIIGMATKSDFDPNRPFYIFDDAERAKTEALSGEEQKNAVYAAQNRQWRNKAVSDLYEPGSVYKIVTGSAAIEEGIAKTSSIYNCPGYINVGDRRISCANVNGHHSQTLAEAFMHSCNPAFISMGIALGGTKYNKYYNSFGITSKTKIDLPGEALPIVHSPQLLNRPVELATTAFGQTFKITPIQMITAICAAVNGGNLMQPQVVNRVLDENQNIVQRFEPTVKRQVVSKQTSDMIRTFMEGVVSNKEGSGNNAYIAGYHIGGKTGTSEKRDTENPDDRISSFCGVAPATDPKIVLLVILDDPQTTVKYGGTLAAPVARSILNEVLPILGVSPDYTPEERANMDVNLPNVVGTTAAKAKSNLAALGFEVKIVGNGANVERMMPQANQGLPKGGSVILYTEAESTAETTVVPKLTGLTVAGVNAAGTNANINISFVGNELTSVGIISSKQSIPEGTSVEVGTIVTVEFLKQNSAD